MRKFIFIPQLDAAQVTPVLKKHGFKLPENVEPRGVTRWHHGNYYGYGNEASWFPLSSTGGIATKAFDGLTVTFPAPIDNKLIALLADKFARDKKAYKAELSEDRSKLRATKDQAAQAAKHFLQDRLTDAQIFKAQETLRKWGCGPTNNRMIADLASELQFADREDCASGDGEPAGGFV